MPTAYLINTEMKYILFAAMLLLGACDRPSVPTPKLAEPQREALEQAKGVDQTLQKETEEQQKSLSEAEGK